MTHEQKYRALTATTLRKFVYGYFAKIDGRSIIFNADGEYDVDPETVGQFIGLYDKNGAEIYEGDEATKFGMITPDDDSTVVYRNGAFGYINQYIGFISFAQNQHFNWFNNKSNRIEVVGNIHENSEHSDEHMREIKFRAMTCTAGTLVHGDLVRKNGHTYIINSDGEYRVNPKTVGQLTPKQDLNGDNIYEDDYLNFDDPEYRAEAHTIPYLVVFDEHTADFDGVNSMNFMSPLVWGHMEIVGNKHQNPELIEVSP